MVYGVGERLLDHELEFLPPEIAWSEVNYESEANDGVFSESDLGTMVHCVRSKSLLNHELELLASKIILFVQMASELVDEDN